MDATLKLQSTGAGSALGSRLGFPLILVLHLACTVWLVADRRMMIGHDGFQYFTLQYYFLNNRVMTGEIPQWIPYLAHGSGATPHYSIQASPLQNVLLLTGLVPQSANFLD